MITLRFLDLDLAICRLGPAESIPGWIDNSRFLSITRTFCELSIVCESGCIPDNFDGIKDAEWICIEVEGPLDLNLTGILASITGVLAGTATHVAAHLSIPVFAMSSYDTDYILVKSKDRNAAYEALSKHFEVF